jgi:hypothetical protein
MGWADCGKDSRGRSVGYAFQARCDHPKCHARIDRGLSYACGGMHGSDVIGCEEYFCEKHLQNCVRGIDGQGKLEGWRTRVCDACAKSLLKSGDGREDKMEDEIVPSARVRRERTKLSQLLEAKGLMWAG